MNTEFRIDELPQPTRFPADELAALRTLPEEDEQDDLDEDEEEDDDLDDDEDAEEDDEGEEDEDEDDEDEDDEEEDDDEREAGSSAV